jgi:hypothetical protein
LGRGVVLPTLHGAAQELVDAGWAVGRFRERKQIAGAAAPRNDFQTVRIVNGTFELQMTRL